MTTTMQAALADDSVVGDPFDLDIQIDTDHQPSGVGAPCGTSDGCAPTCASSCASV